MFRQSVTIKSIFIIAIKPFFMHVLTSVSSSMISMYFKVLMKIRELHTSRVGRPVRVWISTRARGLGACYPDKKKIDKKGAIWCILDVSNCVIMNLKINNSKVINQQQQKLYHSHVHVSMKVNIFTFNKGDVPPEAKLKRKGGFSFEVRFLKSMFNFWEGLPKVPKL